MWELIGELIKNVVMPLATQVGGAFINKAINPPPRVSPGQGGGFMGLGGGPTAAGSNPALMGSGTATRPASLNFTGGFTGAPPSVPSGPAQAPTQQGGFSTLERPRQSQPGGI